MIEVTTEQNSTVEVHVLESGMMECLVGGTLIWPTPEWLCKAVAVQTGKQELSRQEPIGAGLPGSSTMCGEQGCCGATPDLPSDTTMQQEHLYNVGAKALREAAPVCLMLSFDMLHSHEGAAS